MDTPALNRRDVLKVSLAGTAALALPFQAVLSAKRASELDEKKMPQPYAKPFRAPRVLLPTRSDDTPGNTYGRTPGTDLPIVGARYAGTDYYTITQRPTTVEFISGVKTTMWGYDGEVPGPTIRSYLQGGKPRRVVMQQVNALPAKHPSLGYVPWTSTHLHGSPSKPQYDGYAGDLSDPGEWKNYQYPNNCTPRTLWYHDHGVHHTAQNVYMGLAAQYHVVDEALEQRLGIPRYNPALSTYDIDQYEVPLIISDVMFAQSGQLMWDDDGESGVYGDVVLVNGVPWPTMRVRRRKYRFRILNGSLARGYKLRLSNGKPFTVIATDGGFMHQPQSVTQLTIGMAEPYEIVIDFAQYAGGTKLQLLNSGVKNARDYDHTGKVMQFEVDGAAPSTWRGRTDDNAEIDPGRFAGLIHPVMARSTADAGTPVRRLRLERSNGLWVINGETWDDVVKARYDHVFANVAPRSWEIWEVENSSGGWFHPLHVHLVDFQVLSRNGQPPRPEERGPKDVVYVGENETVRLLLHFDHEEGRYMIHCHNLSHEDHDMMTQFQVGHHDVDCDPINSDLPRSGPTDWRNCDPFDTEAVAAAGTADGLADPAAGATTSGTTPPDTGATGGTATGGGATTATTPTTGPTSSAAAAGTTTRSTTAARTTTATPTRRRGR